MSIDKIISEVDALPVEIVESGLNKGDRRINKGQLMDIIRKHTEGMVLVPEEPLEKRMSDAGMLSIDELVKGDANRLMLHSGVNDLETFGQWLALKHREATILFASIELKENPESDDMYEWSLAHHAIYGEIHKQFKAMLQASKDGKQTRTKIPDEVTTVRNAVTGETFYVKEGE